LDDSGTDARWTYLVGKPVGDTHVAYSEQCHALAWHLAWVLSSALGPGGQALFWSAAATASGHPLVPLLNSGGEFLPLAEVHAARQSGIGQCARALVSVFPESVRQVGEWEQVLEQWCQDRPQGQELAVGAMLD